MNDKKTTGKRKDLKELAFSIVDQVTNDNPTETSSEEAKKNPHAVALGRLGGLKGGKARAKKLSKKRRSEIAKKAANTRWSNTDK